MNTQRIAPQNNNSPELTVRAVETEEELRLANDLMAKQHATDYFAALHWLESCGAGYPGFRPEHTRIALWKGELAGALRVNTETVRLGEARLKMGGLGWVTTAPRHRHKGVCRTLMHNTLEYMRSNNYHVSMLFGIPNFYHRFGFTTTLADYAIVMETIETLSLGQATARVREAKPGDIGAVQRLHAACDADVACSLLRSSAHLTNKWDRCKDLRVITNEQGKVTAYFMAHREENALRIDEVGLCGPDASQDLLAACARFAADEAVGQLRFLIPPPHPFARFLLGFKSTHEMRLVRDSGGMMAAVNVGETLESMIPEWEGLLAGTALHDARTETTLLVDRVPYRIRANRGAIDVAQTPGTNKVSLTGPDLMHLLTGYLHTDDVLNARRRMLTNEARAFLNSLFPKRTPYVWMFDRF